MYGLDTLIREASSGAGIAILDVQAARERRTVIIIMRIIEITISLFRADSG